MTTENKEFEKIEDIISKLDNLENYGLDFIFHNVYNYIIRTDYDKKTIQKLKNFLNKNRDFIKSFFKIKNNFDKEKTLIFYCRFWGFGGCERVLSILLPYLAKKYNVILITKDEKGFLLPPEVEHLKIDSLNEDKIQEMLVPFCLAFSVDVFMPFQNLVESIFKYYDIMKRIGIKTIAYNHENYFTIFEEPTLNMSIPYRNERLKNATVVIWLLNYFDNIYSLNNDNSIVMANPLVLDIKNEKHRHTNNIIAIANYVSPYKRLDITIAVFSKILKLKEDTELYLVGDYRKEQLDLLLKEHNIPNKNIHIVGRVDNVQEYYDKSSVMILTSSSAEAFPMVFLEAGSQGIPSVIFNIPGLESVIIEGKNGFIVDIGNLDGMAEKVVNLLQNKELYDYMSLKALELSKRFTKNKFFENWDNLLDCIFTYSNQYDLNVALKERFPKNHFDKDIFIKNIVKQYENNYANSVLYNQKQIKELDNAVKYRDGIIQDLDNAVKYKEKILKDWDIAIKDRNKIINDLNNTVKDRDSAIENLHNQNNILKSSWSYRIGRFCTYFLSIPWEFCKFIRDYNLIKKSKLFDSEYYLAENEDVKRAKIDPIKHYLKFGWKEGRNPSTNFDGNEYLNKRHDVKAAGICPLVHYLLKNNKF